MWRAPRAAIAEPPPPPMPTAAAQQRRRQRRCSAYLVRQTCCGDADASKSVLFARRVCLSRRPDRGRSPLYLSGLDARDRDAALPVTSVVDMGRCRQTSAARPYGSLYNVQKVLGRWTVLRRWPLGAQRDSARAIKYRRRRNAGRESRDGENTAAVPRKRVSMDLSRGVEDI